MKASEYDRLLKRYYTQVFSSIREKSKRRGREYPNITKPQLIEWLNTNGLENLWKAYLDSGCDKNMKPSVDRKDDFGEYTFDNMQLITWRENLIKGVNCVKHNESTKISNQKFAKKVFHYNKSLELISIYESLIDASIKTNIHRVEIQRVCKGNRKSTHGNYFSYTPLDSNFKESNHKLSKSVIQFELNGKFIKKWDKINDASEMLGINPSNITSCCKGRIKQSGGFIWKYFALCGEELELK